jgi:hypothetical protein
MKKKFLLGTTALIAAGIVTGGVAQAAEDPITAGLTGYYRTAVAGISQDDGANDFANLAGSNQIATDIELTVSGNTTLDNGITAGFSLQITGNAATGTNSNTLDERFIFFSGNFGMVRLGQTESARQEMANNTPTGNWNIGINSPFFLFGDGGSLFFVKTGNDFIGNEDSSKLLYFSPTFNGFRIGLSYSPNGSGGAEQFSSFGAGLGDVVGATQNEASVGAEFNHNFGDFGLRMSAGYETYKTEVVAANRDTQGNNSPNSVQFGSTISFGAWSVGGEWMDADLIANNAAGSNMDREDIAIGISYWSGKYGASIGWSKAETDIAADNTRDELEVWKLLGTYVVGPGVNVGAGIELGDFDDATIGAGLDNQWTAGIITANLSF